MRRLLLVVTVLAIAVSGCGRTGSGIGDTAATALEPMIAEVRAAAEARQQDAVKAKLAELRTEVEMLREQGDLTDAGAARILGAAAGVEDQLPLITKAPTQPRPPTTLPRPTATTQPDNKDQEEKQDDEKKREEEKKKEG